MEKYQKQLHEIVCSVMSETNTDKKFTTYQSVLSMVYSLIEDERLSEIDVLLQNSFPDYYLANE
jgi:hypothetical protein